MARGPDNPRRRGGTRPTPSPNVFELLDKPILSYSTRGLVDGDSVSLCSRHPGLQLDKLSPLGDGKMEDQKSALVNVTKTLRDTQLLNSLRARRDATLESLNAACLSMTARGSLTLHLSRSGALENAGIALHPVYGFVYLPGSGIKGLVRSWAETVWAASQPDKEKAWRTIEEAFGWSPSSEKHKFPQRKEGRPGWRPCEIEQQKNVPTDGPVFSDAGARLMAGMAGDAAAGRLVFHDAWPTRWPRLVLDVVNNHHVKYYKGKDDSGDAPGDWEDPTLVYFLAVGRGEEFEFAISDRKPTDDRLINLASGWLRDALTTEGAGAKTSAGYGRFRPVEDRAATLLSTDFTKAGFASASFDLKLVTPAFLAGAEQKREDCDLRPATLRGLLRWWWRTMHAAHLDCKILEQLETAVWGDAKSGSPVRIVVDLVDGGGPEKYDYKDPQQTFRPKQEFKGQNNLQEPLNRKTTQGLFYASYGMDDDRKGDRRRWYRPAETRWSVRIGARRGWFLPGDDGAQATPIRPADLLSQAVASLWLLCRFGGVGSKGRKGFGSFEDIQVNDIFSLDDCRTLARSFRQICRLREQSGMARSPVLEEMKALEEIETPWRNPWTALDQLGYAIQDFAQQYAHEEEKKALGLPRKIHGPLSYPIGHQKQSPRTHTPPQELLGKKGKRHAAPIHYHLAKSSNGKLVVRATAFPAHCLPSFSESKKMLDELITFLDTDLKDRTKRYPKIGQGKGHHLKHASAVQSSSSPPHPPHNELVEAVLVEKRGKNNLWHALHEPTGHKKHIQNSNDVPDDKQPGDRVKLYVAPNNAFDWPTEKVRNRYEQKRLHTSRKKPGGKSRFRPRRH